MIKELWLNLPVRNIRRSKEFFNRIGFSFNNRFGESDESACMLVGSKNTIVMLFIDPTFSTFTGMDIPDPRHGTEVLLSFDAESREEVDKMARRVQEAGGTLFQPPGESQGWLYGFGFTDPDGHRWNMLYMEPDKLTNV